MAHVTRGVELVKAKVKVIQPAVHHLIFQIFFTKGLTHARNEKASPIRPDVDKLRELVESQVHQKIVRARARGIQLKTEYAR